VKYDLRRDIFYFLRATKPSAPNFEKFLRLKYCTYMK